MQPIRSRSVDLSLPLVPAMARNSPASTRRLASFSALTRFRVLSWFRGKLRVTLSTLTISSMGPSFSQASSFDSQDRRDCSEFARCSGQRVEKPDKRSECADESERYRHPGYPKS